MILLLDNYDSFTYNLAHLFGALGADVTVVRSDAIDATDIEKVAPEFLVVSPGPGRPKERPAVIDIVRRCGAHTPTLGVCLGHQIIVEAFGGEIGYARELVHGKARPIHHDATGLFSGLPEPLLAGRYHSLAATRLPPVLEATAQADDGDVMAIRHRDLPIVGVQFHPESVLTAEGPTIAENFLKGNL
ncbi:MAG: aminodeoxychorismate/anthranilate synthase component II [Acidimicrobiales bacterium]